MDRSRTLIGAVVASCVSIGIGAAAQTPPAATALAMLVQADVLRSADRTVRVPVVVGTRLPEAATVRLRVLTAGPAPRVVAEVTESAQAGPLRLVRELPLPAGTYEIHTTVGFGPDGAVTAAAAKTALTVPDPWGTSLAVTPVVLGDTVALTPENARSRPFNFGPTALTPAIAPVFEQHGMLHVAYRVYNWRAQDGEAPDLTAEYVFHEEAPTKPVFFNKVKAQRLTAQTLGKAFDPANGAVNAGMSVSLAPFPPGDYRLTVRVRDNRARTSSEQRVRFTVSR